MSTHNTRIQVEHLITEMISGIDIIEMQINIANSKLLRQKNKIFLFYGHSMEVRIYAETPDHNFFPSTGMINYMHIPGGSFIRVDTGISIHMKITQYYDPILMKISAWGITRKTTINRLKVALQETIISGCVTNISFLLNNIYFSK